ncbi:unnamed protein product [Blepharisma stoltei]|uniref:Uncharacterized protein n=1 Tax=Blepharisma stoltei TaxID=1481888 RepID=A0AAU9IKL5_9CILI|nr:unnamed protein product [Blepharisma stoltei]
MKLSQLDSEQDKNDIESEHLWNLKRTDRSEKLVRINLRLLKGNNSFAKSPLSQIHVTHWMALPDNHFFGSYEDNDLYKSNLFIADENGNIKIIKSGPPRAEEFDYFASCYYDDSIFIFADEGYAERYIIQQNRWIHLTNFPTGLFEPRRSIGFNQKIIIRPNYDDQFWVYDINLDSYSECLLTGNHGQKMIKDSGKIYSINYTSSTSILYCFNPFEEWRCVKHHDQLPDDLMYAPSVYSKGSIYYLRRMNRNRILYEFSLKTFKVKVGKAF